MKPEQILVLYGFWCSWDAFYSGQLRSTLWSMQSMQLPHNKVIFSDLFRG